MNTGQNTSLVTRLVLLPLIQSLKKLTNLNLYWFSSYLFPLNIYLLFFNIFKQFLKKTHCLRNYAKPERTLPDGKINYIFDQVDYRPLFEDPDCPNPLVIRWNGHGIYTPMLQVCHSLI